MQQTLPVAWAWMGRSCSSIAKLHFHSGMGILWKHSYNEPCQLDQPYRERKNPLPDLFFGLWKWKKCTKEKEHYLYQQLDMDSFVTNTWSVISQKNRKLSIHYSASSECFHYTLEASPLYSLNNHPSSSTRSCNSKSHAKYGEETFQSKQAHRIVHRHFLPTNGVPIFYSFELSLYSLCAKCWPLELKSSSYFALRSILAELNYVRCDGRCKTDIETHWVYNPSPDILCGVEMQCDFVIWYL
jgi:hypothetical protein